MNFLSLHKNSKIEVSEITNIATATVGGSPPISAEVTFFVEKSADLMVTKTANKSSVYLGENLTYTIIVTNNGSSDAARVFLIDVLPEHCDLVSVVLTEGSYRISNRLIKCKLGNLPRGHSVILTVTIITKVSGIIQNFARVTARTYDPNPDNNTSIKDIIVYPLEPRSRGVKYF